MDPTNCKTARIYGLAKDHKPFEDYPELRPIASLSGSPLENIAKFVDYHSRPLVKNISSHLDDTPDFLRCLEDLKNKVGKFPEDVTPVTIDATQLFPSIPNEEGISTFRKWLNRRQLSEVPTDFLIELLTLVLECNVVEFNGSLYQQTWGTSMGAACSPLYADLFMSELETTFLKTTGKKFKDNIYRGFFRRFLDDIVILWKGSRERLEEFMCCFNNFHQTVKFTCSLDDFAKKTAVFLDTTIVIEEGSMHTDLYIKPTAANQYLLPSSCHHPSLTRNIPYSLAFRIKRICSREQDCIKRLEELRSMLLARKYRKKVIEAAFQKLSNLTREDTLKKVEKREDKKTAFVTTYDPRLPNISEIVHKHARTLTMDHQMKEIFGDGFVVGYKRYRNIREHVFRGKLFVPQLQIERPRRLATMGWRTCGGKCITCQHSENKLEFKVQATREVIQIKQHLTCGAYKCIYWIECSICFLAQYLGKTGNIKTRGRQHVNAIDMLDDNGNFVHNNKLYEHFRLPGHSHRNMRIFVLEEVFGDDNILKAREDYWIQKCNTVNKGLNTKRK